MKEAADDFLTLYYVLELSSRRERNRPIPPFGFSNGLSLGFLKREKCVIYCKSSEFKQVLNAINHH